eukprot:m.104817 g.104817  ORF g.104817 m.104817 type:complete len:149 (+) comp12619_c0_seq1:326-772(+)
MLKMYREWLTAEGQQAKRLLREQRRNQLAHEVLNRLGGVQEDRDAVWVDMANATNVHLDELVGEFWTWYDCRETRRVVRAIQHPDVTLARVILEGAGLGVYPLDGSRYELDCGGVFTLQQMIQEYATRREATERQRQAEQKSQAKPQK